MTVVERIWLSIYITFICMTVVFMIKTRITGEKRMLIIHAIGAYCRNQIACGEFPDMGMFDRMEPFGITLFRIWDWGCKNILPSEDYEKIKKYLGVKP